MSPEELAKAKADKQMEDDSLLNFQISSGGDNLSLQHSSPVVYMCDQSRSRKTRNHNAECIPLFAVPLEKNRMGVHLFSIICGR